MRKIFFPAAAVFVWLSLFLLAWQAGWTELSHTEIVQALGQYGSWTPYLFVALFLARLVLLIPGSVCIIVGGLLFPPLETISLSLIGVTLAETIIYLLGKQLSSSPLYHKLMEKHPRIHVLLERHRAKFLSFVVFCPFAPTDAACFIAAATGMRYTTFLLSVVAGGLPMVMLYSLAGSALMASTPLFIAAGIMVLAVVAIAAFIWRRQVQRTQEDTVRLHI